MALIKGNKITVSDVNTALGKKIDTAGTGLSKSGTSLALATLHSANSTIGASTNGTLSFGGTFTMPYITRDTYGRVTGGGTRTITMPTINFKADTAASSINYTLPSGGNWFVWAVMRNSTSAFDALFSGTYAGGTNITKSTNAYALFAVRIS